MSLCDRTVVADIKMNCNEPIQKGVESIGYLIRRADIDFGSVEFNASNDNIIETLPLVAGKKAVRIYQQNNAFTGTNSAVEIGTYVNGVTHNVAFIVPDKGPDVAHDIIDPLISGEEFVIILENKYKGLKKTLAGCYRFGRIAACALQGKIYVARRRNIVAMNPLSAAKQTLAVLRKREGRGADRTFQEGNNIRFPHV